MALSDPDLWQRLRNFQVSPPEAVFSFVKRLARENRWSPGFAARVVAESRRFLYLCVIAGRQMTPSEAVGQAWRLHLSCSGSRGQELWRGLLRPTLHHRPTPGGPVERARLLAEYRATLAAYQHEFGAAPPAEIWPAPASSPARADGVQQVAGERIPSGLDRVRSAAAPAE